ncbi:MAG: hypothetical protein JXJ17_14370 [Anaerolineae bacterium]|nr:hypothetical protein [Anaerolineae bacterium]
MTDRPVGVYIAYERAAGKRWTHWLIARMVTGGGTIRFESATPGRMVSFAFDPAKVTSFTIEMIAEPRLLAGIYGGGLFAYTAATLAGRWVKFPVIRLEQPEAEQGQQWIQVRGSGVPQRRQTRKIAGQIAAVLSGHGYSGLMPDLNDASLWRIPTAQIVIGLALTLFTLMLVAVLIWAFFYYT